MVVAGVVAVAATGVAASRVTGNEPLSAKWADWLRGHHMAALAATLEQVYYDHSAPAKGGRPKQLNPVPAADARTATAARRTGSAPAHLAPPTPVPLIVQPAVPGEGQWTPMGDLVGGRPAMYEAQFRADDQYTSQITSAVWIDPTLARLSLVPGATEPGGTWPEPPDLTGSAAAHALAAFNGGFRFQDAHGGFFLDGRTAVPLQAGAASLVISRDGRVDVGRWGSQVTMTPSVTAVLQNLVPIVDDGRPAPDATYADSRIWGRTLHSSTIVARSGVGVTADGAVVYVAGPALSARTLAESLARVGAVRAMSLDINPEWVTFNVYRHDPATGAIAAAKLYPQMNRPATRYLGPTRESRDFFVVSAPGGP
ncbi:MAG TPA: phosphodiester glycosidase family protein [Acidimicrobiales bacterium]|nr:phosphodiester glycosidase family protein [Acidimicrobiales bacterium]